jgi:hypothetical protein
LCGSGSRKIAATTAEICKTRRKNLCSPEGKFYMVKLHFSSKNKEENPLLANGLAFSFGKQGGKSSAPAKAVAFCSAKQGGLG